MELVEEERPPSAAEIGRPGGVEPRRQHLRPLRREQHLLRPPVPALDAGVGGVAAAGVVLQLPAMRRPRSLPLRLLEEAFQGAVLDGGVGPAVAQLVDGAEVGPGGTSAVIADAEEAGHPPVRRPDLGPVLRELLLDVVGTAVVGVADAEGEHTRAVRRLPVEDATGQLLLVRPWPEEDVAPEAGATQELGKAAGMAEAVDVEADGGGTAEAGQEVALTMERLPDQRLAAGDVAVGLDPPAADQLPAPLLDAAPDLVEHARVEPLDPLVVRGGAGHEAHLGMLLHAVQRRAEGGPHLLHPLPPGPEPGGVDVSVADHMDTALRAPDPLLRLLLAHSGSSSLGR